MTPKSSSVKTETSPRESMPEAAVQGTAALVKGINILKIIAEAGEPPVFGDLQSVTGLPKGTLHRILKALIHEGLVRYEDRDKSYHLGLQLLSLSYQVLEELDIRDIARGELMRLRDLTGEAVHLAVPDGHSAIYIDMVEGRHAVGPIARIGSASSFHNSAVGKAIAANLPPDELSAVLSQLQMTESTSSTITSRRKLRAHLDEVRRLGYAVNEEEENTGIHGIAAPVFGHRGEVIGSICITIPSYRFDSSKTEDYGSAVIDAARSVSGRMGHTRR